MKLAENVAKILADEQLLKQGHAEDERQKALRDASDLADKFHDVRPQTFSIPMERFVGLPVQFRSAGRN